MKRVLKILSLLVFVVPMIAATTMYLATEKKYAFTAENLAATIPEFVEDENKQIEMAKKWVELADPDTGMLSIADMFSACRAGGFNTYREVGFTQCRALIVKLIENAEGELDEDFLNGYCPGLDEKGKNPNALSTITDKTRIGGHCSSKNIYAGEVTFRKGYNCTCTAYACNNGYELKKGQCVTLVADGQGNCLRKEFPKTDKVNTMAKAVEFCQDYATKNKCKYTNAIIYHSKSQIVCNAEIGEVDNVKAGMLENQDRKIANLKYYEVCGQHRGKTGKTEHCVDSLFKGVDVGLNEAAGLAQLYAKKNHGKTIYCDTKYRSVSNDDYIKCATLDKDVYYEFKFDDVIETNDATKFKNTVRGISLIYGGNWNGYNISGNCTQSLKNAAKKFGMKTNERYGVCVFEYGKKINQSEMGSKLRTIDGIDNYVFYHEIQLRGSTKLRDNLKAYVKNQGFLVTAFDCDNSYGRIKTGALQGDDEILTCRLSGSKDGQRYTNQPIDFAFDDLSESKKVTREAGEAGVQCIIGRGVYANSKCHGLSQLQCTQVNAKLKAENPKSSGAVWQNGQCVLVDVQEQNEFQNGVQIGLTVISLVDCATTVVGNAQGAMGCTLAVVEITGMVTEMTTGEAMQQRADDFLKIATACHQRSCAVSTIKNMASRVISIQDGLKSSSTANAIDTELARLIGYLEPEDLQSECTGACDYKQIIEQLGGDPDDTSGRALVIANKVGFIAQFASLGASVFRLTGKALAKLGVKASAKATKTGAKVAAVTAAKGADMVSDASRAGSKVASHADDAAALVSHTDDVASVAKESWKEGLAKINVREIDNYQDIASGRTISYDEVLKRIQDMPGGTGASKTRAEELAEIGVREFNTYQDMGGSKGFISRQEVLRRIDDMPSSSSAPAPSSVVNGVDDAGRAFAKAAEHADDAARAANNAADAARSASQADDVADATKGASKTTSGATTGASTATRGATKVDDVTDASRTAQRTSDIAKKNAGQIIQESKKMTYAERQSLLSALSEQKKLEIARLKVSSGEVTLPYGSKVDDLAKNPDLLDMHGAYQPVDLGLAETQKLKRSYPTSKDVDDFLFEETLTKYVNNPKSKAAIEEYGQYLRTKYLEIFKERPELRNFAREYNALDNTQKGLLGDNIVFELTQKIGMPDDVNTIVICGDAQSNLRTLAKQSLERLGYTPTQEMIDGTLRNFNEVISNKYMGTSFTIGGTHDSVIFLNTGNSKLRNFDGYMTYLSHEMGHVTQTISPEVTSAPQIMSMTADYKRANYMANAVEHESWNFQDIVGKDFTKAISSF